LGILSRNQPTFSESKKDFCFKSISQPRKKININKFYFCDHTYCKLQQSQIYNVLQDINGRIQKASLSCTRKKLKASDAKKFVCAYIFLLLHLKATSSTQV